MFVVAMIVPLPSAAGNISPSSSVTTRPLWSRRKHVCDTCWIPSARQQGQRKLPLILRDRKILGHITSSPLGQIPQRNTELFLQTEKDPVENTDISLTPAENSYQQAITRTVLLVALTGIFGLGIGHWWGWESSEEFFAGYLLEQSLSVDNLFVFLLLFDYFRVPKESQERVLSWGIYGAIVTRGVMITLGAVALAKFRPILLFFASILIYSSANALIGEDDDSDESEDMLNNSIVQWSSHFMDSVDFFDGDRFFTVIDGVKKATPLFICMIAVEISDIVFAVDSIPAVFGVTENSFIVFSSNIFAIMGLRSLYTVISKAASDLEYLEPAVAVVLGFIGAKLVGEYFGYGIPTELSLAIVVSVLASGVGISLVSKGQTVSPDDRSETS